MKKIAITALLAVLAGQAWAVNKCTLPDGKVVYQEMACEGDGKKLDILNAPATEPSRPTKDPYYDSRMRLKKQDAIANKRIFVSMTADDVRASWGTPTKINATVNSGGKSEQWVYDKGSAPSQYVYLTNGVVTSIQSPQ